MFDGVGSLMSCRKTIWVSHGVPILCTLHRHLHAEAPGTSLGARTVTTTVDAFDLTTGPLLLGSPAHYQTVAVVNEGFCIMPPAPTGPPTS